MKVYLFNRGRDENIGDNLINEVICHFLSVEGYQIILNSNFSVSKGKFARLKIHLESFVQDILNISRSDITIIGGGNLIMDSIRIGPSWAIHHFWLSLLNVFFRKKYYYLCVGAAPLRTSLAKHLYRFVIRKATKITVRDTFSQQYLKELSGREDILLWFDPVLLISKIFPKKQNLRANISKIGICPIQIYPVVSSDILIYQKYIDLHIKLIEHFVSHPLDVHLFLNDPSVDKRVFEDIFSQLPPNIREKITIHEKFSNCAEYLDLIQNLEFLISSRMHAIISSLSYQIPTIGYGWQPKMRYLYQDQNLQGYIDILKKLQEQVLVDEILCETINLFYELQNTTPKIIELSFNLKDFLDRENS